MRASITLSFILFIFLQTSLAKVHIVDNTGRIEGVHETIRSAYDVASDGDTIYIQPSTTSYFVSFRFGEPSFFSKSLTLLGPGHHPEYNNGLSATVIGIMEFKDVSDIVISGLSFGDRTTSTQLKSNSTNPVNNVQILNNYFWVCSAIDIKSDKDWIIEGNVFIQASVGCGSGNFIKLRSNFGPSENIVIKNNFFELRNDNVDRINIVLEGTSSTQFTNNVIVHGQIGSPWGNSSNMTIENNIFWSTRITDENGEYTGDACQGCIYNNNYFFNPDATFSEDFGNNSIFDINPQFESITNASPVWNYDHDYNLKNASPGKNAGTDGSDLGIYGGRFNFNKYGFTSLPRFISVDSDRNVVEQGNDISITIEAITPGN